MAKELKKLSRSHDIGSRVLFAAMNAVKEAGGQLPSDQVTERVEKLVDLDAWAKEIYQKSGYIRWQSLLHFFSIDCVKSGFLVKKKGVWFLTPEGDKALSLGELEFFETARRGYKKWQLENPKHEETVTASDEIVGRVESFDLEKATSSARHGIISAIERMNEYEFQDLVAALLRGMSYHTPFVAPRGKDGGIDITAYKDPLGVSTPRLMVQVKHRDQSASVQEIRELMGVIPKEGANGLFVSTGGFTSDAKLAMRNSHIHVELVDLDRFIELWTQYFPNMKDEDQAMLPIVPVFFFNANQAA